MLRSDFVWVNFDEQFVTTNPEASRTFQIDGKPVGTGYLLIQAFDVNGTGHRILINGHDLPSFDIPPQEGNGRWTTWMDRIPPTYLCQGRNTITIRAASGTEPPGPLYVPDPFFVANVVIHWRENDNDGPGSIVDFESPSTTPG